MIVTIVTVVTLPFVVSTFRLLEFSGTNHSVERHAKFVVGDAGACLYLGGRQLFSIFKRVEYAFSLVRSPHVLGAADDLPPAGVLVELNRFIQLFDVSAPASQHAAPAVPGYNKDSVGGSREASGAAYRVERVLGLKLPDMMDEYDRNSMVVSECL